MTERNNQTSHGAPRRTGAAGRPKGADSSHGKHLDLAAVRAALTANRARTKRSRVPDELMTPSKPLESTGLALARGGASAHDEPEPDRKNAPPSTALVAVPAPPTQPGGWSARARGRIAVGVLVLVSAGALSLWSDQPPSPSSESAVAPIARPGPTFMSIAPAPAKIDQRDALFAPISSATAPPRAITPPEQFATTAEPDTGPDPAVRLWPASADALHAYTWAPAPLVPPESGRRPTRIADPSVPPDPLRDAARPPPAPQPDAPSSIVDRAPASLPVETAAVNDPIAWAPARTPIPRRRAEAATRPTSTPKILIHYLAADGPVAASAVADALRTAGFTQVELKGVDADVTRTDLRFFHSSDRAMAERIVGALADVGAVATLRDFTQSTPAPSRGAVEVWLAW